MLWPLREQARSHRVLCWLFTGKHYRQLRHQLDSEAMKKLIAALHSPEVKAFILEKYKGAVLPAF